MNDERIVLTERDSQRLVEILNAPPRVIPKLAKAAQARPSIGIGIH